MDKKKYLTLIPDPVYYKSIFNCYIACPVRTKAGNYVTEIAEGNYENAYAIAAAPNPFVNICGRVCGHPCETHCRRGMIDEPVSIRALKRFATEKHDRSLVEKKPSPKKNGRKVAVIGGGPAGLSAAHYLAVMGYSVTLFEKTSQAGGMLFRGIPKYRLPREVVSAEIQAISDLGVEFKTGKAAGKDFSLEDLKKEGFEALFISVGADTSRMLNIEGNDLDGVLNGIDFLINLNQGYKVELGKRVIVVGGGNVAIDVARSVIREITDINKMSEEEMREALNTAKSVIIRQEKVERRKKPRKEGLQVPLDIARSVLRLDKDIDIEMICLESRDEMPAHENEIEEAMEEGIKIRPSLGPQRIRAGSDGKAAGLEVITVKSVFDEKGRFNPTYVEGSEKFMEAETIILAIGQASDLSFISPEDNIETTRRGTIQVDPETLATTAPGIYAGGDVAFGPRLIIHAVADGQKAAHAIDRYLSGGKEKGGEEPCRMTPLRPHIMPEKYDAIARNNPPVLPTERRVGFAEIELPYSDQEAVSEGERCLKCDINTIFDSSKCILCGGCVDICPEYCLKLASPDSIYDKNGDLNQLKEKVFGEPGREPGREGDAERGTVIIKDEERCIRCGLCARRCPTGTITMEKFSFV